MKKVSIVDGNHMLYRCSIMNHHLKTKLGIKTGGLYTFLQSLQFCVDSFNIIVVFDGGAAQWRRNLFPGYKVKPRKPIEELTDDEISIGLTMQVAFEYLPTILRNMGVPVIQIPNEEADDVIYRLSNWFSDTGSESVQLVTEDDDYLQMVNHSIHVYRPIKRDIVRLAGFKEKIGIVPRAIPLRKAMTGDTSDKIPGVYGIGNKTADKLINQLTYPDIDELLRLVSHLKDKKSQLIRDNHHTVRVNYQLVNLAVCQLDTSQVLLSYDLAKQRAKADLPKVRKLFKEFEFTQLDKWLAITADKERLQERRDGV